jgi:hypothetical protein
MNRHEFISGLTSSHKEMAVDEAIQLWQLLASKLILIMGEIGQNALYTRTLCLTQPNFPFLKNASMEYGLDIRLESLKKCLAEQSLVLALQANHQLLVNFTDILATLIGEELTLRILRSAWCVDANPLWKDGNNEQ